MLNRQRLSSIFAIIIMLTGILPIGAMARVSQIEPAQAQADDLGYEPRFEPDFCPVSMSFDFAMRCGFLIVPEDRNNPEGNQVHLAVVVVKSRSENPEPDPILMVQSNLGFNSIGTGLPLIQNFYSPWLRDRDIIILDQRGSGFSQPALNCPEMEILYYERIGLNLTSEDDMALAMAAAERCYERLGVDMHFYNDEQSVMDIRDLRIAMGVDEWNILAITIATRTVLSLVRDYPEGIRSVILDGVLPPDVIPDIDGLAPTISNVHKLINSCEQHPECSALYPDLQAQMLSLIEKLNADPVTVPVVHPLKQESTPLYLTGDVAIALLVGLIGSTGVTRRVPLLIDQLLNNQYIEFLRLVSPGLKVHQLLNEAAVISAGCYGTPVIPDDAEPILDTAPLPDALLNAIIAGQRSPYVERMCDIWETGSAPSNYYDPVESDVPALLMSGYFDAHTPSAWAATAAERLENGILIEVPGLAHSVMKSACPIEIATQFIDDPTGTLDTSCLDEMPAFDFVAPSE